MGEGRRVLGCSDLALAAPQYVENPELDCWGLEPETALQHLMSGLAHLHSLHIGTHPPLAPHLPPCLPRLRSAASRSHSAPGPEANQRAHHRA